MRGKPSHMTAETKAAQMLTLTAPEVIWALAALHGIVGRDLQHRRDSAVSARRKHARPELNLLALSQARCCPPNAPYGAGRQLPASCLCTHCADRPPPKPHHELRMLPVLAANGSKRLRGAAALRYGCLLLTSLPPSIMRSMDLIASSASRSS
jgi:hypothetical protein